MAKFKRSRAEGRIISVRADYGAILGCITEDGQFLHDCVERAPIESRDSYQIAYWSRMAKSRRPEHMARVDGLPLE